MEPRSFPAIAALHHGLPPPPPRWFAPFAGAPPGTALDCAGVVCPSAGPAAAHAKLVWESPPHRRPGVAYVPPTIGSSERIVMRAISLRQPTTLPALPTATPMSYS
uniref:Uncharacterized protein n=1 Tax=Oryza meridionalis TaxID=40149 RepID=A0A0E0FCI4_9ORYZ